MAYHWLGYALMECTGVRGVMSVSLDVHTVASKSLAVHATMSVSLDAHTAVSNSLGVCTPASGSGCEDMMVSPGNSLPSRDRPPRTVMVLHSTPG